MEKKRKNFWQWDTAAFTLVETLVVMVISGILLLAIYEGVGMIKRYADKQVSRLTGGNSLLGGVESLEALFARVDSVCRNGERYLFHGSGVPVGLWKQDSLLIAEHPGGRDTLFRTVRQVRDRSLSPDANRIDSLWVTLEPAGKQIHLGFAPVVREGEVMDRVRELEKRYSDELEK